MGYTHYWRRPAILPLKEWRNWTKELEPLMEEEGKVLADVFIGEDEVYFNGNQACETFYIARSFSPFHEEQEPNGDGEWFACCKTRELPYDPFVVKALVLAEKHFGDLITVSSDGEFPHWPDKRLAK
jgi:hypothetical protein